MPKITRSLASHANDSVQGTQCKLAFAASCDTEMQLRHVRKQFFELPQETYPHWVIAMTNSLHYDA